MFYVLNNWLRRSDARSYRPALPSRFYDGYGHLASPQAPISCAPVGLGVKFIAAVL
jgi:hypothetical protein